MIYSCYDIKGIQSFVFSVPRLKYIIGASILIDRFDHEIVPSLDVPGATRLFSGGGKGVFACESIEIASKLEAALISHAHIDGLNVAIGNAVDYTEASQCASSFYPFLPEPSDLDGHPCQESGLYPVKGSNVTGGVHPVIKRRVMQKDGPLRRRLENKLLQELRVSQLADANFEFFNDIADDSDEGLRALSSLGDSGRWAIICMDGNDVGSQFRHFQRTSDGEREVQNWVRQTSEALAKCSLYAASRACEHVVRLWAAQGENVKVATTTDGTVVLPIRPVVVGGDDLAVICHAQFAFDFVREASRAFTEMSLAPEFTKLWGATGGRLSISAGVLFCPIPLPLHMSIPYCENLLASAKGKGRSIANDGEPSPACIDFEVITESMLDNVADRRNRELRFVDGDTGSVIELTQKPYELHTFEQLEIEAEKLGTIPRSVRQQIPNALRSGHSDRVVFRALIGKNYPRLFHRLDESTWNRSGQDSLSTSILDELELLEERHRLSQVGEE